MTTDKSNGSRAASRIQKRKRLAILKVNIDNGR